MLRRMVSPALPLAIGAASTVAQLAVVPATLNYASTRAQDTARLGAGIAGQSSASMGATAGLLSSASSGISLRSEARTAVQNLHSALRRFFAQHHIDAS